MIPSLYNCGGPPIDPEKEKAKGLIQRYALVFSSTVNGGWRERMAGDVALQTLYFQDGEGPRGRARTDHTMMAYPSYIASLHRVGIPHKGLRRGCGLYREEMGRVNSGGLRRAYKDRGGGGCRRESLLELGGGGAGGDKKQMWGILRVCGITQGARRD